MIRVSVIIRTLNEEAYIGQVLDVLKKQVFDGVLLKIVLVDSGSTDKTVQVSSQYNVELLKISKADFTFGRSLNLGLSKAKEDDIAVCLSGHCIPKSKFWLKRLIEPILDGKAELVFGSHFGVAHVRTSEQNFFKYKFSSLAKGETSYKYFNNGNSAFKVEMWKKNSFDEGLEAQEDIDFAYKASRNYSGRIYYVPRAAVTHIHDDSNSALFKRLLREFEVELRLGAKTRSYVLHEIYRSILFIKKDAEKAKKKGVLIKAIPGILKFRVIVVLASLVSVCKNLRKEK